MRNSKRIKIVAGGTALLMGAGVAYAYWTTSGSGTGSGATTAGVTDTLSFTQNSLSPMFPGDSAQNLSVAVKNTGSESVYVTTVQAFVTTDAAAACDGSNVNLHGSPAPSTAEDAVALTWTGVDLGSNVSANATGTIQFNNTGENQDPCKDATVTIHYLAR